MTDLHTLTASEIARGIAGGRFTAEAVTRAHLERIAARDDAVQAWAYLDAGLALDQARALDAGPSRGPLHGVPFAVKDITDTHDMPAGYGSPIYAGHRPPSDAVPIAMARAAGAVILGKTVTTEFANRHPGSTRNPHNPDHTPGGSSSGSAAAVADCQVPVATGTQTAGSVIRPAAFCGVVGFKPSFDEICTGGTKLSSWSLDTIGVFARSVADAALMRAVLVGARPRIADASLTSNPRIGICRSPVWREADDYAQEHFEAAARRLEEAGADCEDVDLPDICRTLLDSHRTIMTFEIARTLTDEAARFPEKLSPVIREDALADGRAVSFEHYQEAKRHAAAARLEVDALFDGYDLLLTPSAPGEAPEGLDHTGRALFNALWTMLHLPCITLPAGAGPTGLPLGVQLVGRFGEDSRLLANAEWAARRVL